MIRHRQSDWTDLYVSLNGSLDNPNRTVWRQTHQIIQLKWKQTGSFLVNDDRNYTDFLDLFVFILGYCNDEA